MATEVRMPQLGESVTEGTVVRWLKQPGDMVALDEPLAEIETEKVNAEIPSPFAGTMMQALVSEGETVPVGTPIATIEQPGDAVEQGASAVPAQPQAVSADAPAPEHPPRTTVTAAASPAAAPSFAATGPLGPQSQAHGMFSTAEEPAPAFTGETQPHAPAPVVPRDGLTTEMDSNGAHVTARYSPAVLRLAQEHDVDLSRLQGTGLGGRITRKDVQAWVDGRTDEATGQAGATPAGAAAAQAEVPAATVTGELQQAFETPPQPSVVPSTPAPSPAAPQLGDDEQLEPLSATRRAIAAHMVRSVQTAPHAWMMVEVDVSELVAYRERTKESFRSREGVDLSYLPFMIKATVTALKEHPRLNSSWSDDGIILKRRMHIGIAVNTPNGLVVPVIHDADNLSIAGLARQLHDLVARSRDRRLRLEDVQGGTFTVDNVGPIGSVISRPIINPPQCAIVTMESIVKRPVVIGDAIAVRSMMNCCLSFDHRIVDGGDVGPFMQTLKRNLEALGPATPLY